MNIFLSLSRTPERLKSMSIISYEVLGKEVSGLLKQQKKIYKVSL